MCPESGKYALGCRQAVRHQTLTLAFVGSNPAIPASAAWFGMNPAANDPLAQPAEQLPFKQWVRSSNLRRVTKKKKGDTFQVSPFFFRLPPKRFERSNRNCPVDSCCHQFKNWWLHLFSFAIAKENANESPAGHALRRRANSRRSHSPIVGAANESTAGHALRRRANSRRSHSPIVGAANESTAGHALRRRANSRRSHSPIVGTANESSCCGARKNLRILQ